MDDLWVFSEVASDAVVGGGEDGGLGGAFIDDGPRAGAGGVDEVDALVGIDDQKGDVGIESDDADAGPAGDDLLEEVFVSGGGADVNLVASEKSADNVLGGLLGEAEAFDLESGVAENGGNEVTAGDFAISWGLGGAVEVPRGSEPAAHELGELSFEEGAGFVFDELLLGGGVGGGVLGGESLAFGCELADEGAVFRGVGFRVRSLG